MRLGKKLCLTTHSRISTHTQKEQILEMEVAHAAFASLLYFWSLLSTKLT